MRVLNGVDIVEIYRIREDINKYSKKFIERIYTPSEIAYCENKKINKYESYAARFAAKEAVYKAISSKIETNCDWTDIEIVNNECGKPEVRLSIRVQDLENIEISLSHSKEYAIASCIAVYKEKE